jgi:phage tail-like protein
MSSDAKAGSAQTSFPPNLMPLGGDIVPANRFLLTIDGVDIGVFRSVSGLKMTMKTASYTEGGQNGFSHDFPGRMDWENITFSRGLTRADALTDWMNKFSGAGFAGAGNKVSRPDGAIYAVSFDGTMLRSWTLRSVMPVKWSGPSWDIEKKEALTEELEVSHEGFVAKTLPAGNK